MVSEDHTAEAVESRSPALNRFLSLAIGAC
jgi:hypothetical protein